MISTNAAEQAVHALFGELARAWDLGDADAYGACFTAGATYTTFVGTVYRGRDDLAAGHRALFGSVLKGTWMFNEIVDVRFYGDDTAVVVGRGDVARRRPAKLTKVQTYTLVREAGEWRIASFHNARRKPLMEALSFRFVPASAPRR
jgi:uncharacterized protein (TIGR02246 family)